MEDLICVICSEEYKSLAVVPVILPLCGHTFCRSCLESIASRPGGLECPTCRKPHRDQKPALLPTNYALINLVDTKNKKKQENKCDSHNDVIQFWCKVCNKQLCGLCLFENHMAHGNQVSKITEFVAAEKAEIKRKGQQHLAQLAERKSRSCKKFIQALLEVVRNKTSEQLLNQCISQAEKPLDVNQILNLSGKMDKIKCATESSDGNNLSLSFNKSKKPRLEQTSYIDESKKARVPKVADTSDENDGPTSDSDDYGSSSAPKKRKWNAVEEGQPKLELCNRLSEVQKADYTLSFGKIPANTCEQICSFYQKSSDRYANLIWKNQRFHLYALTPGNKGQIKIDISILQEYLSNLDHVVVFMELSESNLRERIVPLGCVYIRVDARTRNGQQFLAMCLGSLGPSYKGAMFNGVCEEGRGLWCGQFCDGFGWGDRVTINYLGKKDCIQVRPGLVRLHKGAAFTIYTQDFPEKHVRCCVGEVISGMSVVEAAILNNDPAKVIIISNVGMVMSDEEN